MKVGFGITPIKRETGESPVRSRRCKREMLEMCHWVTGKAFSIVELKSEDLPFFIAQISLRTIGGAGMLLYEIRYP